MKRAALDQFHPAVREWFESVFPEPTAPQKLGWPAIARGESTLILAPTGSGKTLTAFLWCLNRLLFEAPPSKKSRCRVLYVSPLKALAVDVERNLRAPLTGIVNIARATGAAVTMPEIAIRTGDTPAVERSRFLRESADILITTPESLFLLLTSNARERLTTIDTVIIDEIHALVPSKRGAHLAVSIERLEALRSGKPDSPGASALAPFDSQKLAPFDSHALAQGKQGKRDRPLQRIGLSATQRPLDEVARFLGGAEPRRASPKRAAQTRAAQTRAAQTRAAKSRTAAETPGSPADIETALHDEFGDDRSTPTYRPVTIVDASDKKRLSLRIDVPVEDMARLTVPLDSRETGALAPFDSQALAPFDPQALAQGKQGKRGGPDEVPSGPASRGAVRPSIWASVHPRLLALIRSHQSTLIFVNNRRMAERLAGSLNELAEEPLVRSHHGSLARAARSEVEDLLKAGRIRALVATSSLELGIDMGAIDLVVQIESPPSVASGLQRIGRAGHQAGAISEGIIFPKFRGDLVACAAVARAMHDGRVEATRYPRNPLDVLAQQIVAMASLETWEVDDLFAVVRRAAPYADLSRRAFEGVLDMLSGRYPSDEFAELRPRVTWDRLRGRLSGRQGAQRVAIANAGTIPDRGLYGVFLAGADRPVRVGELDEEMVFETEVGETFVLGASTWRVEEITHDRVLVTPAPGQPGKMPFWHGDQSGRPVELGFAIGKLVRELRGLPRDQATERLVAQHDLDAGAAENLLRYLDDQAAAGAIPDDRTLVIERCLDELGDWRVCVLSPLGSRIHAPWAMAATALVRNRTGIDVEVMWGDEGFVVRFPEVETPPDPSWLLPDPGEVEGLVLRQLGSTSLFAARFRETAARALLLPRRRPGMRTPLWRQRKRAADLLAVASRFGSFPALLETYRELLRDYFDMPSLVDVLRRLASRSLRLTTIDSTQPSPFAASLLFSYVANYIYDGDAPLAERRAQALSVDQAQLRELLGDAELRELLDPESIDAVERQLQHLDATYHARTTDSLHDLLLRIGDLTLDEIHVRSAIPDTPAAVADLERTRRIVALPIAGERRYVAVEDVARYRDALGTPMPQGLPAALLEPVRDPAGDLALRFARSHGPFTARMFADRYGLGIAVAAALLARLSGEGRIVEGEFRPGGTEREWVDAEVLRRLRSRSLARLRQEVEPVDAAALTRFTLAWHGIGSARRGPDALLDAIEQLQGAPIPASALERDVLPARVADYQPAMLDTLMAAGEIIWVGVEPIGERDGRIALYLTDHLARLRPPASTQARSPRGDDEREGSDRAGEILQFLRRHGASFFAAIHEGSGGGFPRETVDTLWDLVWQGLVTNDTLHALRAFGASTALRASRAETRGVHRAKAGAFRSRRLVPPSAEGRWSLVNPPGYPVSTPTEWSAALAQQLLTRHGIVTRETAASENIPGGFSAVYQVLKAMEDAGRVRRGYFVAGLGGAQFALPAALDRLRSMREPGDTLQAIVVAGTDPANPYGAILKWPFDSLPPAPLDSRELAPFDSNALAQGKQGERARVAELGRGPTRTVGALVVLVDGYPAAYLRRGERELLLLVSEAEPQRSVHTRAAAKALMALARSREEGRRGLLIAEINGAPASTHPLSHLFVAEGFNATAMGLQARVPIAPRAEVPIVLGTEQVSG